MAAISNEKLVLTILMSRSLSDVCAATGLSKATVRARAQMLRKAGVKVPKFRRSSQKIDVAALNALVEKIKSTPDYIRVHGEERANGTPAPHVPGKKRRKKAT